MPNASFACSATVSFRNFGESVDPINELVGSFMNFLSAFLKSLILKKSCALTHGLAALVDADN